MIPITESTPLIKFTCELIIVSEPLADFLYNLNWLSDAYAYKLWHYSGLSL